MLLVSMHVVAQERQLPSFRDCLQEEVCATRTQFAHQKQITSEAEVNLLVNTILIRHAVPRTCSDAG
jgi:hypothetical protein